MMPHAWGPAHFMWQLRHINITNRDLHPVWTSVNSRVASRCNNSKCYLNLKHYSGHQGCYTASIIHSDISHVLVVHCNHSNPQADRRKYGSQYSLHSHSLMHNQRKWGGCGVLLKDTCIIMDIPVIGFPSWHFCINGNGNSYFQNFGNHCEESSIVLTQRSWNLLCTFVWIK